MSPEEIRAAAETHHELGPAYRDAVIESFLDKVGSQIDARVDARLAQQQAPQPPAGNQPGPSGSPMTLAITSVALGIPFSAIAVAARQALGRGPDGADRGLDRDRDHQHRLHRRPPGPVAPSAGPPLSHRPEQADISAGRGAAGT